MTFNDAEVVERSLQALLDQTYPVEEVLIVDNGSTDGTVNRCFPKKATVIRHNENRGPSGAVVAGFQYALDKGYDWIWVFDADSAPRTDALEKLLHLYKQFSPEVQLQTRLLASLPLDCKDGRPYHGLVFSASGLNAVKPVSDQGYYELDATMWTGCLFKLAAVEQIGFPYADYFVDGDDYEYGYRGKCCGYKAFMLQDSIVDHNIGGQPSMGVTIYHFGSLSFKMIELPPIRCYYVARNTVYFWLYEYKHRNLRLELRIGYMLSRFIINFVLRPASRWPQVRACYRGLCDGFFKNMHHRY